MNIFNTIKWKLLAFSFILVIVPTVIVGILTYRTFYKETFNNAEENLRFIVHDWLELTDSYYQQTQRILKYQKEIAGNPTLEATKTTAPNKIESDQTLKQELLHKIGEQKICKHGYIWVLNTRGKYLVSKDRRRDGENIMFTKDDKGVMFIKEMIEAAKELKKDDVLIRYYPWQNKGESEPRKKLSAVAYFPEWGWVIGASAYETDFQKGLRAIKYSILIISLFSVIIGSLVAYIFAGFLTKPIRIIDEIATGAVDGDLTAMIPGKYVKRKDEIGHLSKSFNAMMMRLKTKLDELVSANDRLTLQAEVRQEAEDKLCELQDEIIAISRKAGMNEIATGVIHNVGNVLTSVTISSNIMEDELYKMKIETIFQIVEALKEHKGDLASFFEKDEVGKNLTEFIEVLGNNMKKNQVELLQELMSIKQNIEHIRVIIRTQQEYARIDDAKEAIWLHHVVEDAIRIDELSLSKRGIEIQRDYGEIPEFVTEKHKLLQIVTNLVKNTRHAFDSSEQADKKLIVATYKEGENAVVKVTDNGVGIPKKIMDDIFGYGFTTHEEGHGFGLHSAAIAAKELGGCLRAESDGEGKGAVFTLEIPVKND